MDPRARGCFRVLPVQVVGQRDVHRVHFGAGEAFIEVLVVIRAHSVFPPQLLALPLAPRNQPLQLRILRVLERRQHRLLRDAADSHHRVTDLFLTWHDFRLTPSPSPCPPAPSSRSSSGSARRAPATPRISAPGPPSHSAASEARTDRPPPPPAPARESPAPRPGPRRTAPDLRS